MKSIIYVGEDEQVIQQLKAAENVILNHCSNALILVHLLESEEAHFDLIIVERRLTGMNGIESFLKVKNFLIKMQTPFILIDDHFTREDRLRIIRLGVDDIYRKPINVEAILSRLSFWRHMREFKETNTHAPVTKYVYRPISIGKRIFDIVFSSLALLFLSPLLFIVAILIKVESKGPVYYISKRVGTGYRVFDFYKLRSMYLDADKRLKDIQHLNQYSSKYQSENQEQQRFLAGDGIRTALLFQDSGTVEERNYLDKKAAAEGAAFTKIANDPRITKIGRIIRNTSIDELPQLINVLKGDMSIVGNRPLPLYEAEVLTDDDWSERFLAPAGITGLWQVEKRGKGGEMSEEERKSLDNIYAKKYSLWFDIKLILRTIPALFQKDNV